MKKSKIKKEKSITKVQFEKYYENPKNPGAFSGLNSILKSLKEKYGKIDKNKIKEWIIDDKTYTLHKPKIENFLRNKTQSPGIDFVFQADLIDLKNISKENDGYVFILMVIDVFSKYAWAIPLKNKKSESIIEGFEKVFKERKPIRLQTDQGLEFLNKECVKYLDKNQVKLYYINSEMKAAVVERLNRTIKEKMWRYFTNTKEKRYIDILDDLMLSYNNSYHRSIKMKPVEVNIKNEDQVWLNLYGEPIKIFKSKLKIGDKVRLSKEKRVFEKGYTPNWSKEIFVVHEVKHYNIPVYIVKDLMDEIIEGVFYENELQKVTNFKNIYDYNEILKTRTVGGKKEYFISWDGYPSKFNQWVPANRINL